MLALTMTLLASITPVEGTGIRLDFDEQMRSRVVATAGGEKILGPFSESETLLTASGEVKEFALANRSKEGRRTVLTGRSGSLRKEVEVTADDRWPKWLFVQVRYTNEDTAPVEILGYTNNRYWIEPAQNARGLTQGTAGQAQKAHGSAQGTLGSVQEALGLGQAAANAVRDTRGPVQTASEPAFWSYQSSSHEARPDWLLPLGADYSSTNHLGMNDSDYGGGTPLVDVWRRDVGIAVGHIELTPKLVSLPIQRTGGGNASLALVAERRMTLKPGESTQTVRSFVAVHTGDHFNAVRTYSQIMQAQGIVLPNSPASAFDPIWCAWGYGREFTPQQVFDTLPVVKQLGFKWAVLDDGWQVALGDWQPRRDKFPRGDADMKALVKRIHASGLKAQLWWAPLAANPGSRTEREHPDWLLRNQDGTTRKITWWDSQYLCPAVPAVQADAAAFARKALAEWGFDGLKIDGQHLNDAPVCTNPAHKHQSPEDAPEAMPAFFKAIWQSAQAAKPGAVVEICPCGTGYSFFTLPYLNMTVASDPESSWQVRLKGKTLKALTGDRLAYFGDHVEMSAGGQDYASTFGIGGVIGTNFAWPGAPGNKDPKLLLTPEREALWAKWTQLYEQKRLSEGTYDGSLYDIGFDKPEAHVVRKGAKLYYAFFADRFDGTLELRGLDAGTYQVTDYVNNRDLGSVTGPEPRLSTSFTGSLLLEVSKVPM